MLLKKKREKRQKKARERYQNFTEEENEKKRQEHHELNKNLSEEQKWKLVKDMGNYYLACKKYLFGHLRRFFLSII